MLSATGRVWLKGVAENEASGLERDYSGGIDQTSVSERESGFSVPMRHPQSKGVLAP